MTSAWILDFGARRRVAVGSREQIHLLTSPLAHELPAAPPACRHLLFWNGRVVPVLDLGLAISGVPSEGGRQLLGIYAYARGAQHDVGAIWLAVPPRLVRVDDSMACALPVEWQRRSGYVLSCIKLDGQPVPILDLTAWFDLPQATRAGVAALQPRAAARPATALTE
jgi:hypothetical protein